MLKLLLGIDVEAMKLLEVELILLAEEENHSS
jgi:hypothetical protein